tara:strand:+ start:14020 stop:15123 length:1104 start_codon:yes stop_codon:yes gene_type:complete
MIDIIELIRILKKNKINFYTGVPDSILKSLSNYLCSKKKDQHIIATNEGSAVSLAIGYHLSTNKIPCVYMQNSGLGNSINPIVSIAHRKVYSIPLLFLIGWRGSPNSKDEPQHMTKGNITTNLLKLMNIKYIIIKKKDHIKKINKLVKYAKINNKPVAILFTNNVIKKTISKSKISNQNKILRRKFIEEFLNLIPNKSKIISTTGYTSRELYQVRKSLQSYNSKDFYMVGGMGHAAVTALGVSLKTKKQVYCLDGDGSLLMHMGSMRTIGKFSNKNLKHILLNNNAHESVGVQETTANKINFKSLSLGFGYKKYYNIDNQKDLRKTLIKFLNCSGPAFLEVKIKAGTFKNLIRPKNFIQIKKEFCNS